MKRLFLTAAAVLLAGLAATAAISPSAAARLAAAARVVQDAHTTISRDYWDRARCVIVIPELKKAAFILGAEYGRGVLSCRSADGWSAPVFMQLAKGSLGLQAGAAEIDVVMLVMNEQGVQKLLDSKVNLGAGASIAAGAVGRQAQASTDVRLGAEILAYSRAQGLFAGIDLSGGVLRPDEDVNRRVYGAAATPRTILATRDISAPTEANAFMNALNAAQKTASGSDGSNGTSSTAASVPVAPSATVPRPADSDLRARIVDMQQTLDRMLSDPSRSAVGTSGTSGGAVTVDRVRLLQLRDQLDALLAAIDQRSRCDEQSATDR